MKKKKTTSSQLITPVSFFKLLADENRLKSLLLISHLGELCVCELMQALDVPQPKISRHLALLRSGGIVLDRRQGQWVYYRLNPDLASWMLETINTTATENSDFINVGLDRLKCMSGRPDNKACCG